MRVTWNTVSPLDRVFDDVMGSMLGTATSPRTFEPAVDVRANDDEVVFVCDVPVSIRIPKHPKAKPKKIAIRNGRNLQRLEE